MKSSMDMREWTEAQLDAYARQLDEQVHAVYERKLELQAERDRRAMLPPKLPPIVVKPAAIASGEKFGKT